MALCDFPSTNIGETRGARFRPVETSRKSLERRDPLGRSAMR